MADLNWREDTQAIAGYGVMGLPCNCRSGTVPYCGTLRLDAVPETSVYELQGGHGYRALGMRQPDDLRRSMERYLQDVGLGAGYLGMAGADSDNQRFVASAVAHMVRFMGLRRHPGEYPWSTRSPGHATANCRRGFWSTHSCGIIALDAVPETLVG